MTSVRHDKNISWNTKGGPSRRTNIEEWSSGKTKLATATPESGYQSDQNNRFCQFEDDKIKNTEEKVFKDVPLKTKKRIDLKIYLQRQKQPSSLVSKVEPVSHSLKLPAKKDNKETFPRAGKPTHDKLPVKKDNSNDAFPRAGKPAHDILPAKKDNSKVTFPRTETFNHDTLPTKKSKEDSKDDFPRAGRSNHGTSPTTAAQGYKTEHQSNRPSEFEEKTVRNGKKEYSLSKARKRKIDLLFEEESVVDDLKEEDVPSNTKTRIDPNLERQNQSKVELASSFLKSDLNLSESEEETVNDGKKEDVSANTQKRRIDLKAYLQRQRDSQSLMSKIETSTTTPSEIRIQCEFCGKAFAGRKFLEMHIESNHLSKKVVEEKNPALLWLEAQKSLMFYPNVDTSFLTKYPPIQTARDRKCYEALYKKCFLEEYMPKKMKMEKWQDRLILLNAGLEVQFTDEVEIKKEINNIVEKQRTDPDVPHFKYLHEKLAHIKRMGHEWDEKQSMVGHLKCDNVDSSVQSSKDHEMHGEIYF